MRAFGRWPVQHARSEDPDREAEQLLGLRVSQMKRAGCLPPDALNELQALQAEYHRSKDEHKMTQYQRRRMAEVRGR